MRVKWAKGASGWLVLVIALLQVMQVGYATEGPPSIDAAAAVLIEQSSGRILYQKNADVQLPMASTTKIMTAYSAIVHGDLDEEMQVPASVVGVEGSSIYLEEGERLSLEDLLYGLMLRSGNDAAEAIALMVGKGDRQRFIEMMNMDAAALGLSATHFENPHGLPADGHFTTAFELAKITAAAYNYSAFAQIVQTKRHVIPWDGHEFDRAMVNKNKLLTSYEGANGVKTGYTKAAGRCLVSGAKRNGMQLIAVVLNCPDMWNASEALLDYGFAQFEMVDVLDQLMPIASVYVDQSKEVKLLPGQDLRVPIGQKETVQVAITADENLTAPIARGQALGYARVAVGEDTIAIVDLLADREVLTRSGQYKQNILRILRSWL